MKKTFNIFNTNLFSNSLLFIELTESKLILAHAKKKYLSRSIYIINVSTINIEQTCFRNSTIYKPRLIQSHISIFLDTQKLQYPKTFVSIPNLANQHDLIKVFAVFQISLCISSTKVKISSLVDSPFFDAKKNLLPVTTKNHNLLDLIGNNHIRSPLPWLISWLMCLIALAIGFKNVCYYNSLKVKYLRNQITKLQHSTNKLNEQVKNFAQTKTTNTQIKNSLAKLEDSFTKTQNPLNHILEIASKIPKTAYLTNLNFYQKPCDSNLIQRKYKIKKQSLCCIELEGQANTIQSTNHFIHKLTKNTDLFKKIDILYVKKFKYSNKNKSIKSIIKNSYPKYQFKAVGELKYIC